MAVIFVTLVVAVVVVIISDIMVYCSEGNSAQGLTHAQTYLRADTPNNSVSGRGQHCVLLPFTDIKILNVSHIFLECQSRICVELIYIIYIIIRHCLGVGAFPRPFCVPNSVALASLTLQVGDWAIH